MVKVVSLGPHQSVVKEVICKNCGAVLQYVPMDVQQKVTVDYTGGKDTYHYIECPPCKNEISVRLY